MGDRRFYLYPRNGIYYAEILDPETGVKISYRSTRTGNRDEAAAIVGRWLAEGIPTKDRVKPVKEAADFSSVLKFLKTGDIDETEALEIAQALKNRGLLTMGVFPGTQGKQRFIQFLRDFWNYESSVYLEDRRAHGKNITRRTCRQAQNMIDKDWESYFGDKTVAEIARQDLRKFGISLKKRLAGKTVNNVLHVGLAALRWGYREKMIPENITEGLGGFTGGGRKRDIFTEKETEKLFNEKHWKDKTAYAAALLAATSGLRNGEIRALRGADVGDKLYTVKTENGDTQGVYMLYVRHGWNYLDTLKPTKNEEEGTVHLLPQVRDKLLELLEENPYTEIEKAERFLFWGIKKDRPCGAQRLLNGLHYAMKQAEIELGGRNIDLHSFRHENGTVLLRKTKDIKKVAKSLRHKSLKMTEHYTDHVDLEEVAAMGAVAADTFKKILRFAGKKGA